MGEKRQNMAPINLEQARAELIRAEELLKQRHANTRLVLQKQKEVTEQLERAKAQVSSLQRQLKEERRQKEKHKADGLEKDRTIEKLRGQLKASRYATSQSVTHPQTPSDEDNRSVQRSGLSVDSMNVSQMNRKRKVGGAVRDKQDMLVDMLDHVLGESGRKCSRHSLAKKATEKYLGEIPATEDSWMEEMAEAALSVLLEKCVLREAAGHWADMAWSPSRWFDCMATERDVLKTGDHEKDEMDEEDQSAGCQQRSLVATWCDPSRLEEDYIPWLLACLRMLEEESQKRITDVLLDMCIEEVLVLCSGATDLNAVPKLCCAVTVAIALCKMSENLGVDFGMKLLVDIMGRRGPGAENRTVALAVALEVWPELAVVVEGSQLNFTDAVDMDSQHDDIYEMALLTLGDIPVGKNM